MSEIGKYYMLVNPYIEGSALKIFKADNSMAASKEAYESFSKYFNNKVPSFNFTLLKLKSEDVNNNKLHKFRLEDYSANASDKKYNKSNFSHFTATEEGDKKNQVSFTINKFTKDVSSVDLLIKNIMKIQDKFNM